MKGGHHQKKQLVEEKRRLLTDKEERDMKLAFDLYDLTGCGVIARDDALNILSTLGYKVTREDNLRLNAIISASDVIREEEENLDIESSRYKLLLSGGLTLNNFIDFFSSKLVII